MYERATTPEVPYRQDRNVSYYVEGYEYLRREHPEIADAFDAFHEDLEASYQQWRAFVTAEQKALWSKLKALKALGNDE
jgi:hypothetical protein